MQTISRRRLFAMMMSAAALAGCATTTVGTSKTLTINVAKINAYVEAGMNAANTVLAVVKQFPAFAIYNDQITTVVTNLQEASAQFTTATNGQLTVSYDNSSVKTIIASIFTVLSNLASIIKTVLVNMMNSNLSVPTTTVDKIQLVYTSIATLVSILKAMIYPTFAQADMNGYIPVEEKALRTLNG